MACHELAVGDTLLAEDGRWLRVDDLLDTGEWEAVYNLRVADDHTYFVGCDEWGFSVWAHNSYGDFAESLWLARNDMRFEAQYRRAMQNPGNWNAFQRQLANQGFSVQQKAAAWRRAMQDAPEAAIADQVYRETYQ